jgi:glutathione S-transferase
MASLRRNRLSAGARCPKTGGMKLYAFDYSPYVRKVQLVLNLLGRAHQVIDVPYSDRDELASVTGGYIYVPVLVDDDRKVVCDSRAICQHLLTGDAAARLVPPPLDGPIWAYHDWCDGPLEDVMFRIASPTIRDRWKSPCDRALYVLVKERKFGAGCVTAWEEQRDNLVARANDLLAPTARTLAAQPFIFGATPTLADAALYGQFAMLRAGDERLLGRFGAIFRDWIGRLERHARG